jgi:hypothetical protein
MLYPGHHQLTDHVPDLATRSPMSGAAVAGEDRGCGYILVAGGVRARSAGRSKGLTPDAKVSIGGLEGAGSLASPFESQFSKTLCRNLLAGARRDRTGLMTRTTCRLRHAFASATLCTSRMSATGASRPARSALWTMASPRFMSCRRGFSRLRHGGKKRLAPQSCVLINMRFN